MDGQQSGAGFPGLFLECEESNLGESLVDQNQELIQEFIVKQVTGHLESTLQIFIKIVIDEKSMIQAQNQSTAAAEGGSKGGMLSMFKSKKADKESKAAKDPTPRENPQVQNRLITTTHHIFMQESHK